MTQSTMSVEAPAQRSSATAPALRKIDFSANAVLRQVSTMLRRAWLLDPPLSHEELAEPETVQECFRSLCETIGNEITAHPDDAGKWDHAHWLAHTQLTLLGDPVVAASAAPADLTSVVSPWREEIYDIYRHVFSDLWRTLLAETSEDQQARLGRFDPAQSDAVSLVVLPAEEAKVDKTAFTTDTLLYPVWVNPGAAISFSADGTEHSWSMGEGPTWTTGLWVQAGRNVVLRTDMKDVERDQSKIAAVFVTGHCSEVNVEQTASEGTKTAHGDGHGDGDGAPAEAGSDA